jgi:hypothetical protein
MAIFIATVYIPPSISDWTNDPAPAAAVWTKAVVAIWVVLVAADAVGAVGVPVNAGDPANTRAPVPVSSEIMPASCAEVVAANCDNGLAVKPIPVDV